MVTRETKIFLITFGAVILLLGGILSYISYSDNKTATANTILNLEKQLEEQGQLSKDQEKKLEELAEVNCKEMQIPYDALEEYAEQEPYTDTLCENINLVYKNEKGTCTQYEDNFFSSDTPSTYSCTIANLDNEAGYFSIDIGFNIDGQTLGENQTQYIYPQSSQTFYAQKMAYIDSCYCLITSVPTKQECETVTRYRTVTKTRTVTKYRTETICE